MPRRGKLVDDSEWSEVKFANGYALLIGYLSMAVKGLGFLVLTWTTVVLLGGYVSTLQKKDFWCLTFITLVQTAGIFDVILTEKLSYIWGSALALRFAVGHDLMQSKRKVLADVMAIVQLLVFVILLCPLAAVYMFGLLISAGISVWRLRQHDYGISDADGLGNLKPALDVLYSIALLQGVIFCYKTLFGFAKGSVANAVLKRRGFGDQDQALVGISDYLLETTRGCEKDPSFAGGRNLITYAVDLMGSKSPDDYVSGVRILDAFARRMEIVAKEQEEDLMYDRKTLKTFMQEHILMKHLTMSASPTDLVKKLLRTLGLRSLYDRETRACAARIVAHIAASIELEEFPTGILYISSLIDSFKTYSLLQPYQRDWAVEVFEENWYDMALHLRSPDSDSEEETDEDLDQRGDSDGDLFKAYKELMVQGFHILRKLATNGGNCRIMLDTPLLLQKIVAPMTFDLLHHIDHDACYSIVEGSLEVIFSLVAATGQTGTKLRSKISSSKEAISTMERILECDRCDEKLQGYVIKVLKHLYMDTSLILDNTDREKFIEMLVDIMTDNNKDKKDRRAAAAQALMPLCSKPETGAMSIIVANDNVVKNLTRTIVQIRRCHTMAAKILEFICTHYTNDDESLIRLKKAMTDAVPKVLGEIVCWASEETHKVTVIADQVRSTEPETDLENQSGISQDYSRGNNASSSTQKHRKLKLNKYSVRCLLSFCVTVWDTLISADQDLTPQFESTTPMDGVSTFPMKLKQIVRKNMHQRPHNVVTILKITCKMVISMMKHRGSYVKEELESLMDALSTASKEMFLFDGFMVFDTGEDDETMQEPFRSLVSLLKEAQELVDKSNEL